MLKKLLLPFFALLCFTASGQGIFQKPNNSYGTTSNRQSIDSTLYFPTGCGVPTDTTWLFSQSNSLNQKLKKAALYYDSCGHKIWIWDPHNQGWAGFSSGVIDTTSLSNRINGKLNTSDTALMLLNYARSAEVVANLSGAPGLLEDVAANRPVSAITGVLFLAVDTKLLYRYNGTSWDLIGGGGGSTIDTTSLSNRINLKIDSIRRKTGSDSVFMYYNGTKAFAFRDSIGTTSAYDSASSQGGGFHTQPYNDTRYLKKADSATAYSTVKRVADTAAALRAAIAALTGTDTTIFKATGASGLNPFTLGVSGGVNQINFPKYRDTSAQHTVYTPDSALAIADHDTTSANALQSKAQTDSMRANLYASLNAKMVNFGGAPGQLQGTFAALPSATSYATGTTYIAQDSGFEYVDTGSGGSRGWKKIAGGSGSGSSVSPGNPSGLIGWDAANGIASTYTRSDARHGLDSALLAGYFPRRKDSTISFVTPTQAAPVINSGAANKVIATPDNASGVPALRSLVVRDLPATTTFPAQTTIGDIYNKTYFTANDLASDILVNASGGTNSSVSVINGKFSVTASSPSYSNYNFVLPNRFTMLNHIQILIEFTDSVGGNGFATTLHDPSVGLVGYMSGNAGASTLNLLNQAGSAFSGGSGAGPTIVIGHLYRTILTLNDSVVTFSGQDLTTGGSVTTATYNYPVANGQLPRIANFGFFAFSGIYNISKIQISSTENKYPNLIFVGDSKTREYTPSFWNTRYAVQVGANYPNYVIYAGTAMKVTDILALKDELTGLNGQTILLNIGSNDIRATGFTAQFQANYTKLVNILAGGGAKVYHTVLPEDSTAGGVGLTAFKSWVAATWASTYIDNWTGMTTSGDNKLKASYNTGDGIHPNQAGNNQEATTDIASGFFTTLDPTRKSQIRTTDQQIRLSGDSAYLAFQIFKKLGYVPYWNSDGNLSFSPFQWNGTTGGFNKTGIFTATSGADFTFNSGVGFGGATGGIYLESRNGTPGVAAFSLYVLSNGYRGYSNARSKDLWLMDTIGRNLTGIGKLSNSQQPSAYVDFAPSDGTAGNAPLRIRPGTKVTTPDPGNIQMDSTANVFLITDKNSSTDSVAGRAWARSIFATIGSFFYQTVQSNTTSQTQRAKLNFGPEFVTTDNSGNGSTDITSPMPYVMTTDASAITNTTTPGSLKGTGFGSLTFPANYFTVGKTITLKLRGLLSTDVTNTGVLGFNFSTSNGSYAFSSVPDASLTNQDWDMELICVCRAIGASGTGSINVSIKWSIGSKIYYATETAVNFATTSSQTFDLTSNWAQAISGNSIQCKMFNFNTK